jgi:hypothetical protein
MNNDSNLIKSSRQSVNGLTNKSTPFNKLNNGSASSVIANALALGFQKSPDQSSVKTGK